MSIPLDQGYTRPAAFNLEREQVLVEGIIPARPGVPAIVGRQLRVESGSADRALPGRVDLPPTCAPMIGIRLAPLRSEHRPLGMCEHTQCAHHTGRQSYNTTLTPFGAIGPKYGPGPCEVHIAPIKVNGL